MTETEQKPRKDWLVEELAALVAQMRAGEVRMDKTERQMVRSLMSVMKTRRAVSAVRPQRTKFPLYGAAVPSETPEARYAAPPVDKPA